MGLSAKERQRRAAEAAKAVAPVDPRYAADPREAARAIDGAAMKARGETPPWEEEEEEEASCEDVCTERCQGPCGWADA